MSPTVEFVKIHSLISDIGQKLNGKTGRLKSWHQNLNGKLGNNRYEVVVGTESYMIKLHNMYALENRWIEEVSKSPMRKRMQDMMTNFEAPGFYPCPISDLEVLPQRFGGPGTKRRQLQSWWGDKVFQYIREKMEEQRHHKGQSNWDMSHAINEGTLKLAGVRSDGGHFMQEHPSAWQSPGVMVLPTIVFPRRGVQAFEDGLTYWSYCQGLALDGSSPWKASPDALEIYGPYQFIAEVRLWPFGTLMIDECKAVEDHFEYNEEEDDEYANNSDSDSSQDFEYNEDEDDEDANKSDSADSDEGWQLVWDSVW